MRHHRRARQRCTCACAPDSARGRGLSATTGLGLLDLSILEAIDAAGAGSRRPYLKSQRVLDLLYERTGIGPRQAYEPLCDMARPFVVHLATVDFHGNYGSPDFGPAAARYTECRLAPLGEAALAAERDAGGPLPIALINGDLHLGGRRPPLDPTRALAGLRAAARGAADDELVEMVGMPAFPSGCEVAGDLTAIASGRPGEIVASASMVERTDDRRSWIEITTIAPFTSVSEIAGRIQHEVDHWGRWPVRPEARPNGPPPVSDVNDGSAGGQTELVVTARAGATLADLRRFLDDIRGVHQHVQVELGRPLATLIRQAVGSPIDVEARLAVIEQAIRR
jgi:DNA gyrase subunit A